MAQYKLHGGDKLRAKLAEISKGLRSAGTLRVGFLENATYPDGTSVAQVAAIQEFGAPKANIPPRPFFRTMIADKSPTWGGALGKVLASNGMDGRAALDIMGQVIKGELQESIVAVVSPPLAPATIARKGFDKPLVDTGHMLNSADYEVKE